MVTQQQFMRRFLLTCFSSLAFVGFPSLGKADKPYFVTYDAQMEEPGNLEIAFNPVLGLPQRGQRFWAAWTEFEYGAKGWWTTEFYLDGQSTQGRAPSLLASAGKTASDPWQASIGSILCSTWNLKT